MTTPDGSWLSFLLDNFLTDDAGLGGFLHAELKNGNLMVTFLPFDDAPHVTERYRVTRID